MVQMNFIALCVISLIAYVAAECPNACSAHGKCGAYDMCICYRNWMANDCSERTCQFGMAHVDSPKGDLDASSGALSGPSVNVIPNDAVYPYGTTEQYPAMVDSEGNVLLNTDTHTWNAPIRASVTEHWVPAPVSLDMTAPHVNAPVAPQAQLASVPVTAHAKASRKSPRLITITFTISGIKICRWVVSATAGS